MTETEKLLARIGTARDAISSKSEQTSLDYMIDGVLMNCSVMLKEQGNIINSLNSDLNETLDVVSERLNVVRCKDCWKRPYDNCPFNEHLYYQPEDDFFCADGERSQVTVK